MSEDKPKQKLPWSNPHGRMREAVRVVRSMPSVSSGAFRCFDAIAHGINDESGVFICRDEVMAALIGIQSRQSIYRYRKELRSARLIDLDVGCLGEATVYRVTLSDADILAGLENLKESKIAARDRAADDQPRRDRVTELLHDRRPESIGEAAIDDAANQICYTDVQQICYALLPDFTPSDNIKTESHFIAREGLSEEESRKSVTANDGDQRQANSEDREENPPLDDDAEHAIEAFRQDRRALRIIGQGDGNELANRLRYLTPRELASIAKPWFLGGYPSRRCAFAEVRDLAAEAESRLNRMLKRAGAAIRPFALMVHLDEAERTALLTAVAGGADATEARIAHAIDVAVARDADSRRRFVRYQAEHQAAQVSSAEQARREALVARFRAREAKAAKDPAELAPPDLVAALGRGDASLGARRAAALVPDLLRHLVRRVEAEGPVAAAGDITDAIAVADNALDQRRHREA